MSDQELQVSLASLATDVHQPSIHFVPFASPVGRHPGWRAVERDAVVLEEPVITRESLMPVLRYLGAITDLARDVDLLAEPLFTQSFMHLIEDRAGLPEAIQAFDERVLLCTDPTTNRYDDTLYRRDVARRWGRWPLLPSLRDLVALRRENDLVDLLNAFDERRAERGWTASDLVAVLSRMTGRLLEPAIDRRRTHSEPRSRVAPHRAAVGAVLWAALVLAWEDALTKSVREEADRYRRGPDLLVPVLAGLGRDFLAREDRVEAGDPLAGRWADVVRSLGRCGADVLDDPLEKTRGGLVRGLAAALARSAGDGPEWFGCLRDQAWEACGRLDDMARRDEEREEAAKGARGNLPPLIQTSPPAPLHRTFTTVIGRGHAVAGLGRHARERKDGVDLLLHGPDEVGKRTLAWSYARMVLCVQPSDEGAPCGDCDSCRAFDTGHSDCISVDGAREDIENLTAQIVKTAKKRPLYADQFVFVIRNADRYPPAEFDKLLKPMEDSVRVSLVLLARDRGDVRVAGQSRCFDYRVRPLSRSEAERFVREILAERGQTCNGAVLTLLLDAGGGLPGRLHEACSIVVGKGSGDLADIRSGLGLNWAEGLVARWPEIVAEPHSVLAAHKRVTDPDRAEQVRRVRAVLHWILSQGVRGASLDRGVYDPALRHLDADTCAGLAAEIDRQADREGVTAEAIWTRLAETWMADRLSCG